MIRRFNTILLFAALQYSSLVIAQAVQVTVTDAQGQPVADAVVELRTGQGRAGTATVAATVDQIEKEFVPVVSTIQSGSTVSFPNSDDILHHVYSFSPIKTFNIPLYGSSDSMEYAEAFAQPGVVEIGCNIHDWMLAYIYVAASGYVSKTNETGVAILTDLPLGEQELSIWHAQLAGEEMTILSVTVLVDQTIELEVTVEIERGRRVRRAPSANRKRYR